MAKKKKNKGKQQQLMSDTEFVRQKARSLEIGKCYKSVSLFEIGEGYVVVIRNHKGDKYSVGFYMIDTFCTGVKDTFCRVRITQDELDEYFDKMSEGDDMIECSYNEAHNIIYGAIAFAEEAGIMPNKAFNLTQYLLEEDTDEIPLIEYEYGKDGQHVLFAKSMLEASKYLPAMKAHLGKNFRLVVGEYDDDYGLFDDHEEIDEEETDEET